MLEHPLASGPSPIAAQYSGSRPSPLRRLLRGSAPAGPEDDPAKWKADGAPSPLEVILTLARRHWLLISLLTVCGVVAALLVSSARQPIYRARGSLEVLERNQEFLNTKQILPFSETGPSSTPADVQTHVKKLQSDNILGRAVERTANEIASRPAVPARVSWLPQWLVRAAPSPATLEDRIQHSRNHMEVRTDNHTRIIELFYEAPDPVEAATFINVLASEFTEDNAESRSRISQRTRQRLLEEMTAQRRRLEAAESALQQYASRANLLLTSDNGSASSQRLRSLQDDLLKARSERLNRQSRYEMAVGPRGAFMTEIVSDSAMVGDQARLAELKRQHAEMSVSFNREYPKLKKLEAQIASVTETIETTRARIVHRMENDFREAANREQLLGRDVVQAIGAVQQDARHLVQYEILNREVESNRQLYMAMLQRVNEAGIATAMQEGNVRILDTAPAPRYPVKPNRRTDASLGAICGLLIGCLLAVWRDRPGHTPRSPGDVEAALALPELGAIPFISAAEYRLNCLAASRQSPPSIAPAEGGAEVTPLQARPSVIATREIPNSLHLLFWQNPHSRAAEAFRAALASILFSGGNGEPPRTLVVASCHSGEGKSTVASNLAGAAAELHQRVLLIDGNLQEPCLHEWFGVSNDFGWMNLPAAAPPKSLLQIAKRTVVDGLYVLPAGELRGRPYRPPSEQTLSLLASAGEEFDLVIIDTPPLIDFAAARVFGRLSDGVVLVVRSGDPSLETIIAARRCFARDGTRFFGAILNGWETKDLRRNSGSYLSRAGSRKQYHFEAAAKL